MLDRLYAVFLRSRFGGEWGKVLAEVQGWLALQPAQREAGVAA